MKFVTTAVAGIAILVMAGAASAGVTFDSSWATYRNQKNFNIISWNKDVDDLVVETRCTPRDPITTDCKRYTMPEPLISVLENPEDWRLSYHRATIRRSGCASTFLNYDWDMLRMTEGHVYPSEYRQWASETSKGAECIGGTGGYMTFWAKKSHESNRNLFIKNNNHEARIEFTEAYGLYGERQFNWVNCRVDL